MNHLRLFISLLAAVIGTDAATIARFDTSVGIWDLELYDEAKPITVSNFIKSGTSGRYANQLIHRWVPGFVIQGGGYRVDTSNPAQWEIVPVNVFGAITNEAKVGTNYSNIYGTIAMARLGGQTNSATSQWFINLGDNGGSPAFLDSVDNGFTVFGRVISATNVLNLFIPDPPTNGIYIDNTIILGSPMAVLSTNNLSYDDLVYVQLSFRRDLDLKAVINPRGLRQVSWNSVAGVTNVLEYTSTLTNWVVLTNFVGTGERVGITDLSADPVRTYRAKLFY